MRRAGADPFCSAGVVAGGIVAGGIVVAVLDAASGFDSFALELADFPSVEIDSSDFVAMSASGAKDRFAVAIVGEPTSEGVTICMWENNVPAPKHASAPAASKIDFIDERRSACLGRGTRGFPRVN